MEVKKLCDVYGENWAFVQAAPHISRPTTTVDDKIKALIATNWSMITRKAVEFTWTYKSLVS